MSKSDAATISTDAVKPLRVFVTECRGTSFEIGRQMATGFLATPRGRAFARRRERRPFGFSFANARAALETYAPNLWEELHGIAEGMTIPLERAAAEFSNGRLRFPRRGCSALTTGALYGRNYDFSPQHYDRWLAAIQPKDVYASVGFVDRFTGRLDGMNEHGLCVGLHRVNEKTWQPGLVCVLIVRMVLDQCATTAEAIALLRRIPHGLGFNYSLLDSAGEAAVVEAAPAKVEVRKGSRLACTNHFQTETMQAYNRRNSGSSRRRLPPLETWANSADNAAELFVALNDSRSPAFHHEYASGGGTLHTIVADPADRTIHIGIGGDATPIRFDLAAWLQGVPLGVPHLDGHLGGHAKPFDPSRRARAHPIDAGGSGGARVFVNSNLANAVFDDVSLKAARFNNVNLAAARFDDVNFSNTEITENCNFSGMRIGGVAVKDLFAAYRSRKSV